MELTGGEIVVKHLVEEQVPYVVGIPGHGVLGLFDALRREEQAGTISYLQVKHEQAAAAIADGYFRVSGRPLAIVASIGPGTLNTSIGLGTAYVDSTALLALCGDTHVRMKGVGVLQEVERHQDNSILRSLEPLTKRAWRAESVQQLPRIMRRAFDQMTTGRHGPCVVMLPMDVQSEAIDIDLSPRHQTKAPPAADADAIGRAVALMRTARRPVILMGGGARGARAGEAVVELAERWGAAMITTMAAKGTVAETHPQYGFHTGSKGTPIGLELTRNADVVLALGCRFADETTCSYRRGVAFDFPDTKLIHVDLDPHEIGKNYPADVGIVADLNAAVEQLLAVADLDPDPAYLDEIVTLRKRWFEHLEDGRSRPSDRLTISQLVGVMNQELPADTYVVTSSGNTQAQLFQEYCCPQPYRHLTTGGFSTMGWAFPAALGAKLAAPESPVVAFVGDGDFLMTMQELSTMAQYGIPVVVLLADNSGWLAIKDLQTDALGEDAQFGNDFCDPDGAPYSPDFVSIAEGFGITARRETTAEGVARALREAVASGAPALICVDVCRDHPDSGGRSFGWWDVPVPAYLTDRRAAYEAQITEEF